MTPMLTTPEVAALMRCNTATLLHMVAVGEFPQPFRRGRPHTWSPQVVADVLDGRWTPATTTTLRAVS